MQNPTCLLLVISLSALLGCSEVISTSGARTATVDVVGEPTDPIADSMQQADIVGSAPAMPDDIDSLAEATPTLQPQPFPEDAESDDPANPADVVGGVGEAKPVSLKKKVSDQGLEK